MNEGFNFTPKEETNDPYGDLAKHICYKAINDYAIYYKKPNFEAEKNEADMFLTEARILLHDLKNAHEGQFEHIKARSIEALEKNMLRPITNKKTVDALELRLATVRYAENLKELKEPITYLEKACSVLFLHQANRDRLRREEFKKCEEFIAGEQFLFFSGGMTNGADILRMIRKKVDDGTLEAEEDGDEEEEE